MNSKVPAWIVVLLWIAAVLDIVNGIEMFFFPSAWFFKLVPGVPETGPYNMHLVADGGTFFLAIGVGLVYAAINPRRNAIAVVVAAIAGVMHSALHIYSHAAGLLTDPEVAQIARTSASIECPAPRGGVLTMRPLLIHASSKARDGQPRRVLHIEYADSLDLAIGVRFAVA